MDEGRPIDIFRTSATDCSSNHVRSEHIRRIATESHPLDAPTLFSTTLNLCYDKKNKRSFPNGATFKLNRLFEVKVTEHFVSTVGLYNVTTQHWVLTVKAKADGHCELSCPRKFQSFILPEIIDHVCRVLCSQVLLCETKNSERLRETRGPVSIVCHL